MKASKTIAQKPGRVVAVNELAAVVGGAFEGYLALEFEKQGKNKGTSPRK